MQLDICYDTSYLSSGQTTYDLGSQKIRKYKKRFKFGWRNNAKSPFKKLKFSNSSQKTLETRHQTSLVLYKFTGFFYFTRNVSSRIVAKSLSVEPHLSKITKIAGIKFSAICFLKFCTYSLALQFVISHSILHLAIHNPRKKNPQSTQKESSTEINDHDFNDNKLFNSNKKLT